MVAKQLKSSRKIKNPEDKQLTSTNKKRMNNHYAFENINNK